MGRCSPKGLVILRKRSECYYARSARVCESLCRHLPNRPEREDAFALVQHAITAMELSSVVMTNIVKLPAALSGTWAFALKTDTINPG